MKKETKPDALDEELRKLGTPVNLKDKLYQKILLKHVSKGKPWKPSDTIIWKGSIYVAPIWIGYLIFAAIFGWFFIKLYDNYGYSRMIAFIAILILWRMNMINTKLAELIKKLS